MSLAVAQQRPSALPPLATLSDAAPFGRQIASPYLLFLGDVQEELYAKTAFGLRDWARERCVGEYGCGTRITTGLPYLSPEDAYRRGARAVVIGVANPGGQIPANWVPALSEALAAGLDVVSGMHQKLSDDPLLKAMAAEHGRNLIDVRCPPEQIPIGTGRKRSGKRLLTVGTDCALGKKYTALSLARAFKERKLDADFRATGQTGILIAGRGIPMDAVVSDFLSGAAEMLTPDAEPHHWDVIEGQGSIFHPSFAGVSLGLLHGSQPDVIVLCHQAGRHHMMRMPGFEMPDLETAIDLTLTLARRTNPAARCGGVSLNTSRLEEGEAKRLLEKESERLNLPVADPIRGGEAFERLVDSCLA